MPRILIAPDVFNENGDIKSDIIPEEFEGSAPPVATEAEAEAGADNTKMMTALRTAQAIASQTNEGLGLTAPQVRDLIQIGVGMIDLNALGAVPGSTDDQSDFFNDALQKGINYLVNSGYKTNIIGIGKAGTYNIDSMVWIGRPEVAFSTVWLVGLPGTPYDKNNGAMNGVTIKYRSYTGSAFGVQAVRDARIIGINIEGMNDINPGNAYGSNDPDNYLNATLVANNPNADSRDLVYAGIVIDPYSGDGVTPTYDGQVHTAASSSGVKIIRCNIRNFVLGGGVQVNGRADANGDFVQWIECSIKHNKYGLSTGNSQSRQHNAIDCHVDENYLSYVDNIHGKQEGRFSSIIRGHVSGYQMLSIGSMARTESLLIQGVYIESLQKLGHIGGGSGAGYAVFDNCKISLSHQQSTYIPSFILSGDKVKFVDTKITSATFNMKLTGSTGPSVFKECTFVHTRDGIQQAYADTFSRDFNTITNAQKEVWKKMYKNVPFIVGPAIFSNCKSVFGDDDNHLIDDSIPGTQYYKTFSLPNVQKGTSGVLGDYWYKSKSNAPTALVNRSLTGKLLKYSTNGNTGWNDFFTPAVKAPGDVLVVENTTQLAVFLIFAKGTRNGGTGLVVQSSDNTGDDYDAMLLGGFEFNGGTGALHQFIDINTSTLFTDATVTWYSANHHDHRSIKCTATAASDIITNLDWVHPADDNGSQTGGPSGQFKVGDIVYLYQTANEVWQTPTSKVFITRVQSIDSTSQITLDTDVPFSGANTLIFSKWPYAQ